MSTSAMASHGSSAPLTLDSSRTQTTESVEEGAGGGEGGEGRGGRRKGGGAEGEKSLFPGKHMIKGRKGGLFCMNFHVCLYVCPEFHD